MAHSVQTEIERKYAVGADTELPALTGVGEAAGTPVVRAESSASVRLEAVYFDTADLALARQRIALRVRRGGHDEGWHVKLPAAEGRTELQWPLEPAGEPAEEATTSAAGVPDAADEVPASVRDAVREHVGDAALTPLARVSTDRALTDLLDADGAVVAELADDLVRTVDARQGAERAWREWEAELGPAAPPTAAGRTALLDEIEQRLLAAGATVSPSVSKLAQALGRTGLGH
ncbi:CYTH domain-containing protein [Herbiconiux sp.]|uniref:CYTH domain-containing protein n=1 Tax=Herbiconiux sp. TaxID=1871186 RepID=UPI0025C39412|nr:CYTH domain-containing protein [Herbiconiux sp.]